MSITSQINTSTRGFRITLMSPFILYNLESSFPLDDPYNFVFIKSGNLSVADAVKVCVVDVEEGILLETDFSFDVLSTYGASFFSLSCSSLYHRIRRPHYRRKD